MICFFSVAAKSQSSPAELLADRIATRMKDTLDLSIEQKNLLYTINMNLHERKLLVRQQFASSDSLTNKLQKVEASRDSLYRRVLPEEKYLLYRDKKRVLISN